MRAKTRRKFSSEFKGKVALEAIQERQTIEQICKQYDLHPSQVNQWKKEALNNMRLVFESGDKPAEQSSEILIEQLYAQIGQLKVANDFLKKKLQ